MIWEPFLLALVLGLMVSAGLYFAYLWPSVEPVDDDPALPSHHADVQPTNSDPPSGSVPGTAIETTTT